MGGSDSAADGTGSRPEPATGAAVPVLDERRWDADHAVTALYGAHYRPLVRLAALLLHDVAAAEEVVQEAFIGLHGRWSGLRDSGAALGYLRRSVVNGSRSALRHRDVVERHAPAAGVDGASAEEGALAALERQAVVQAVRALPARQREAMVLRYYADLSEEETATAMGISRGSVKTHTSRGLAAVREALGRAS